MFASLQFISRSGPKKDLSLVKRRSDVRRCVGGVLVCIPAENWKVVAKEKMCQQQTVTHLYMMCKLSKAKENLEGLSQTFVRRLNRLMVIGVMPCGKFVKCLQNWSRIPLLVLFR